jgi:Spy/CpxP family protein refolding chaperone
MKHFFWRNMPVIVLMFCALLSASTLVLAHPPGSGPFRGGRFEKFIEELGLEKKTLTEVKKILDASRATRKEMFDKLREAHEHMRALLEQEKPDESAVMAQADAIGALETESRKQQLRTMLQVQALLTPEQRAKLLEMLRTRRPHGRRGFHEQEGGPHEFRPPRD